MVPVDEDEKIKDVALGKFGKRLSTQVNVYRTNKRKLAFSALSLSFFLRFHLFASKRT